MAEVIKLTDKYIDTSGVYDTNLSKTQSSINSILSSAYSCDVYYSASGDQTFASNIEIKFNSIISNVGNCYSTSTGRFTCPVTGLYIASFGYFSNQNAFSASNRPTIYKNGSMEIMTSVNPCNLVDVVYCSKGDTISAGCYFGSISFYCGRGHNWFKVALLKQI